MYTRQNTIAKGDGISITSYGNGAAYLLADEREGRSVFFQGDDADTFRTEFEAAQEWVGNGWLGHVWGEYAHVATEDRPT